MEKMLRRPSAFQRAVALLLLLLASATSAASAFVHVSDAPSRIERTARAAARACDFEGEESAAQLSRDSSLLLSSSSLLTPREARVALPMSSILAGSGSGGLGLGLGLLGSPSAASADSAPEAPGNFRTSLNRYFPTSFGSAEVASRVLRALSPRGYIPGNVLLGTSLCSDEVNYTPQSLGNRLSRALCAPAGGGAFNLGGLGGLPFVGTSGFGAFFSHAPGVIEEDGDDKPTGKCVILFGPHVGIAQDGTVGKVERIGRKRPSTSCGAAIGAYKALIAQKNSPGGLKAGGGAELSTGMNGYEFQENYIINRLRDKISTFGDGSTDIEKALVTYRTYEIVWELLKQELDATMDSGALWESVAEVTLLGGIVINQGRPKGSDMSRFVEDYFQPVKLERWRPKRGAMGYKVENLFDEAFGD